MSQIGQRQEIRKGYGSGRGQPLDYASLFAL
jgi:hypothetical protein